jgi:hypothetical protein
VVFVSGEELLVHIVERWAAQSVLDDPDVCRHAALVALYAYTDEAPVSEACRQARVFVASRTQHPARRRNSLIRRPLEGMAL